MAIEHSVGTYTDDLQEVGSDSAGEIGSMKLLNGKVVAAETVVGAEPYAVTSVFHHSTMENARCQTVTGGVAKAAAEGAEDPAIPAGQSITGTYPKETLAVLQQTVNGVLWQPVVYTNAPHREPQLLRCNGRAAPEKRTAEIECITQHAGHKIASSVRH
jgi:hypothetical protein